MQYKINSKGFVRNLFLGLGLAGAIITGFACSKAETPKYLTPTTTAVQRTYTSTPIPTATLYNPLNEQANTNLEKWVLPDVRDYVINQSWYKDGISEEEALLIRGLATSSEYNPEYTMKILHEELYAIEHVHLQRGDTLILTMGESKEESQVFVESTKKWLPIIEDYLGDYPQDKLLINIVSTIDICHGAPGFAILDRNSLDNSIMIHEFVHSYFIYPRMPLWFAEGSAEFTGRYLTGLIAKNPYPYIEIPASELENHDSALAKGYSVLREIYFMIDHENMSSVLKELNGMSKEKRIIEDDIRDVILRHSPEDIKDDIAKYYDQQVFGR